MLPHVVCIYNGRTCNRQESGEKLVEESDDNF